jgi:hypothetical protein
VSVSPAPFCVASSVFVGRYGCQRLRCLSCFSPRRALLGSLVSPLVLSLLVLAQVLKSPSSSSVDTSRNRTVLPYHMSLPIHTSLVMKPRDIQPNSIYIWSKLSTV